MELLRRKRVIEQSYLYLTNRREENNPESTPETWQLMLIIVNNVNQTLTKGISLRGIIELGRFLRTMATAAKR